MTRTNSQPDLADRTLPREHLCANCGERWTSSQLAEINDIFQRVEPGEEMPSGECPECGALTHIRPEPEPEPENYVNDFFVVQSDSRVPKYWCKETNHWTTDKAEATRYAYLQTAESATEHARKLSLGHPWVPRRAFEVDGEIVLEVEDYHRRLRRAASQMATTTGMYDELRCDLVAAANSSDDILAIRNIELQLGQLDALILLTTQISERWELQ